MLMQRYGPDSVLLEQVIFEDRSYKTSPLSKCGFKKTWNVKVDIRMNDTVRFSKEHNFLSWFSTDRVKRHFHLHDELYFFIKPLLV